MKKIVVSAKLILVLALLSVGVVIIRDRTMTLKRWVSSVSRPGYHLLDAQGTGSHFIAVFRTDAGELGVCTRRIAGATSRGRTLEVRALDGSHAGQCLIAGAAGIMNRRDNCVVAMILDLLGPYSAVDGDLWRITPGYAGPMRVSLIERTTRVTREPSMRQVRPRQWLQISGRAAADNEACRYERIVDWQPRS